MSALRVIAVAVPILLALSGLASGEEAAGSKFVWPSDERIQVREIAVKNGKRAVMKYDVALRRGEDGNSTVKLANYEFVQIDGLPITLEMLGALKPAVEAFNSMPALIINRAGELVEVADVDASIDATGKLIGSLAKDEKRGKEMMGALKNERARELLRNVLSEYWACWVEGWIEFPATEGKSVTEEFEQPLIGGTEPVAGTRQFTHLGEVEGEPGKVHLKIETSIEDPALTRAITQMIRDIDKENGKEADPELDTLPNFVVDTAIEAKIDLETLRPTWAKRSKTVRADSDDPEHAKLKKVETHEYHFRWE